MVSTVGRLGVEAAPPSALRLSSHPAPPLLLLPAPGLCDLGGGGQGRRCVFSDSCITKGLGRGPEKWHASNTVAPGQVQLNLSLRISHGRGHGSLWSSRTLSQGPVFLACRWTWTVCPPLPVPVASLVALRVCSVGDIFPCKALGHVSFSSPLESAGPAAAQGPDAAAASLPPPAECLQVSCPGMVTADSGKASVFYYFGNHRSDTSIEEILSPAEFKVVTESVPEESSKSCISGPISPPPSFWCPTGRA